MGARRAPLGGGARTRLLAVPPGAGPWRRVGAILVLSAVLGSAATTAAMGLGRPGPDFVAPNGGGLAPAEVQSSSGGAVPLDALDPRWERLPAGTPRYAHSAIYDTARHRMIVHGGLADAFTGPRTDRELDFSGDTPVWRDYLSGGTPPRPRQGSAIVGSPVAVDPSAALALFVCDCINGTGHLLDLQVDHWERAPSDRPLPYWNGSLFYDVGHERALHYGGDPQGQDEPAREGWAYDFSTEQRGWSAVSPLPEARMFMASGVGPGGYAYAFGGQDERGDANAQLWRAPIASQDSPVWSEVTTTGEGPTARVGATLTFDPETGLGFLFGGYSVGRDFADVWLLQTDPSGAPTWRALTPTGAAPSARSAHSAAWDPEARRLIVHGGVRGEANGLTYLDDTWALYPYAAAVPTGTPPTPTPTETASPATSTTPPPSTTATDVSTPATPPLWRIYLPDLRFGEPATQ